MAEPGPARTRVAIIVGIVAILLILVLAVTLWAASQPPTVSYAPLSHLSIVFAADKQSEVNFFLGAGRAYVQPGDAFDLVWGNASFNFSELAQDAQLLKAAFPEIRVYSHTSGLANYSTLAAGVGSNVSGILYDYEPGFEPEFTLNFSQTLHNFENVTTIAHEHGLLSVGYPTGRPILAGSDQKYAWNYGELAERVDRLIVQSQTYCLQGVTDFANATEKVLGQYASANLTSSPTFQITIGNSTTLLPNGVTAGPAYQCAKVLTSEGLGSLYIWSDPGGETNVLSFLQYIGH